MSTTAEKIKFPVFKERFSSLRGEMTQEQFAKYLKISRPTIGFYENGERLPDALVLARIAKKCNVSSDWLLGLTDVKSHDVDIQRVHACTGLSEKSITELIDRKRSALNGQGAYMKCLNDILESPTAISTMANLLYFKEALKAKAIYDKLWDKHFMPEMENGDVDKETGKMLSKRLEQDLEKVIKSGYLTHYAIDSIRAELLIWSDNKGDADLNRLTDTLIGVDGFELSDIYEYRLNQYIALLIQEAREYTAEETAELLEKINSHLGDDNAEHNEADE